MKRASPTPVLLLAIAALGLATNTQAQLTHTATAQNNFSCVAGPSTDAIPAGSSLSPSNSMSAFYSTGGFLILQADASYQTSATANSLGFSLTESGSNFNLMGGGGTVSTGPNDSLWVIQSAQPITGTLTVVGTSAASSLFNTRIAYVDVDDDGSIEWSLTTGGALSIPLTINGSRTIRVTTETIAALGTVQIDVDLVFSVSAAKETFGTGCGSPLALDSNLPVLGSNWVLTTTGIDAVSPSVITFFGARGSATPLMNLGLNAPGCDAHLQSVLGSLSGANGSGTGSVTVFVPNAAALVGTKLSGQSVCLTTNNAAGLHTSNGLEGTIGG